MIPSSFAQPKGNWKVVKHDKKPAPPPIQKMKNTIGKQMKRWQAGIGNCFIVYLNINSLGTIDSSLLACEEEGWELHSSKELCEDILATSRTFWDEQWTKPLRNGTPRVRVSSSQIQAYARTLRRQVIEFGTWMKSRGLGWLSRITWRNQRVLVEPKDAMNIEFCFLNQVLF